MKQFYETYQGVDEKLSAVLRVIVPQAEHILRNQYVIEFIGGNDYEHENFFLHVYAIKLLRFNQGRSFIICFASIILSP